jgi:hypothetical protein
MNVLEFELARYVYQLRKKPKLTESEKRFLTLSTPTMRALKKKEELLETRKYRNAK